MTNHEPARMSTMDEARRFMASNPQTSFEMLLEIYREPLRAASATGLRQMASDIVDLVRRSEKTEHGKITSAVLAYLEQIQREDGRK